MTPDENLNDNSISIQEFEDIIEISPFPIIIHKSGVIRYANRLFYEMFEIESPDKIIGNSLAKIVYPEDLPIVIEAIKRGEMERVRNSVLSARMVTGKGNVINTETKSVTINFRNEECRLVVAYNYDEYSKFKADLKDKTLLLEKISEIIPDSLIVVDNLSREVLFENKPLYKVLGYDDADLNGSDQFKLFSKIVHPDDLDKLVVARKFLTAPENEGKYLNVEYRVKDKSGKWRWLLSRSTLFKRLAGEKHQLNFGIAQDITQIKETEEELRRSKIFAEKLTNTSPNYIALFDLVQNKVVFENFNFATLLGYPEEYRAANPLEYFHPDYVAQGTEHLRNSLTLKEGEIKSYAGTFRNADGSKRTMLTRFTPFSFNSTGTKATQLLTSIADLQELSETSSRLEASEREKRTILMALPDILLQLDRDCSIVNVYSSDIYRNAMDELKLQGQNARDLLPPDFFSKFQITLHEVIETSQLRTLEYLTHFQEQELFLELRINKLSNESVIVVVRDITNLKTTRQLLDIKLNELSLKNEELEKYITSNTELEKFAYIASHDLREPIRSLIGFTQLLKKHIPDNDTEANDFLQNIIQSAHRMNTLVHGLLDYSRISASSRPFENCDLNDIMRKVVNDLKASVEESGAEIRCAKLPVIRCDEVQIRQLFQNLISNSIKFRKPGVKPVIQITCSPQNEFWLFNISDNGIGMDMRYKDKVFEIFSRLHTHEAYQGSGIGLTVCKKIVERHGGEIKLESELNKGTTFFFTLQSN